MPGSARRLVDLLPQARRAQRGLDRRAEVAAARRRSGAGPPRHCRRSTSSGTGWASGTPCRSRGAPPRRRRRGRRRRDRRAVTRPSARAPGISSCMRLMQRTIVDLPQPEGPMIAVTSLGAEVEVDAPHLLGGPVEGAQALETHPHRGPGSDRGPALVGGCDGGRHYARRGCLGVAVGNLLCLALDAPIGRRGPFQSPSPWVGWSSC